MTIQAPGWYPDQDDHFALRWFDGDAWTAHVESFEPSDGPAAQTSFIAPTRAQLTAPLSARATEVAITFAFGYSALIFAIFGLFAPIFGAPAMLAAVLGTVGVVGSLQRQGGVAVFTRVVALTAVLLAVLEGIWMLWGMLTGA